MSAMGLEPDDKLALRDGRYARKRDKWVSLFGRKRNTSTVEIEPAKAEINSPISKTLTDTSSHTTRSASPARAQSQPSRTDTSQDEEADIGDLSLSNGSWERAYQAVKFREPDLVFDYERILASGTDSSVNASFSLDSIVDLTSSKLQDREATQLVIKLGKQPIKVREQGEKVIKFILWAKEIISAATSTQPFAALAWFGVSMLLKVYLV